MDKLLAIAIGIFALFFICHLPGTYLAAKSGACSQSPWELCVATEWNYSFAIWLLVGQVLVWTIAYRTHRSREAERACIAEIDGREFRIKDRVQFNEATLPRNDDDDWMRVDPDNDVYPGTVRAEPGRTGTVHCAAGLIRTHVVVEWDAQKWREYHSGRDIWLESFKGSPAVDWLDVVQTSIDDSTYRLALKWAAGTALILLIIERIGLWAELALN